MITRESSFIFKKTHMKARLFILLLLGGLLIGATARAADIVVPTQQKDANVNIGSAETHKNLYVVGGNLTVNGNTQGDLTAAGGMITVTGSVEQEAIIAGGNIAVSGPVGGTARIAGGNLTVSGPIGGDLVIAGGNVNIAGNATIAGDLLAAGGNVILDAPVNGSARIGGGSITINSKINGDLYVMTSRTLVFGPQAEVVGTVHHTGTSRAVVQQGAKVGNIQFTPYQRPVPSPMRFAAFIAFASVIKFIAILVAAFILAGLLKKFIPHLVAETFKQPWSNLGIGLVGMVVTPIAIIICFVTVIGFFSALILGAAFGLTLLLVNVLAAIAMGYLILGWFKMKMDDIKPWQAILLGTVVSFVLLLIPVIGWIADAIVFLMVFGAFVRMIPQWGKEIGKG